MFLRLIIVLTFMFLFTSGCASMPAAATPPPTTSRTSPEPNKSANSACRALSNEEIRAVQGEMVSETKGNDSTSGELAVSHCVYLLPTYSKSLSLDITKAASSNAGNDAIEKFWEKRFAGLEEERERDSEKARESDRKRSGDREEEEKESKPRPVAGVGDEAFWVGSGVKGALYVRKGDTVLILSIGGSEAEQTRIKKTTALAQHALKRLN